jgi:hypothetical protein
MSRVRVKERKIPVLERARADRAVEEAVRQTYLLVARKHGVRAFLWGLLFGGLFTAVVYTAVGVLGAT